jgi:predicted RNase H-like nuclease (RuvC/YqgF family)
MTLNFWRGNLFKGTPTTPPQKSTLKPRKTKREKELERTITELESQLAELKQMVDESLKSISVNKEAHNTSYRTLKQEFEEYKIKMDTEIRKRDAEIAVLTTERNLLEEVNARNLCRVKQEQDVTGVIQQEPESPTVPLPNQA